MATKLLILAVVHAAAVHAAPHTASVPVQTVVVRSNFHAQDETGQYAYGYSSEDGQYKKEVKTADGKVRGLYGYNAPDGRHVLVRYKADDGGFVAESDFLEQPGVSITQPVVTVQQESVPDSREGDGITIQQEAEDPDSPVQVDQDAYSNLGYSSYQQGTYYVSDGDGYNVAPYQETSSYVTPSSASKTYYSSQAPASTTTQSVDTGGLSEYDSYDSLPSGYADTGSSYYTYGSSTPSVASSSSNRKYYSSQRPVVYDSQPSGYADTGSSYYTYGSSTPSVASSSSNRKYYSPQRPVVYAVHDPYTDRRSQYAGYGVKHSDYSVYAQTPNRLTYDKLFYPSKTSVVYVPPPEPRVYYPKDDSYTYNTAKPAYEVRPAVSTEEHDPYKPKTRVAVNVLHHGTPNFVLDPVPMVSPVPVVYSSSAPVLKVHVGSPGVSVVSPGTPATYQVTPSSAVKTVSLTPIQVKVHSSAAQPSYVVSSAHAPQPNYVVSSTHAPQPNYVVSSTPAPSYVVSSTSTPVKVASSSVYKTKPVSIANPFKVHYVSPAVKVKAPSVQAHSYYYTAPSPAYKTVSSYASAGNNYVASSPVQSHSYYYTVPSSSAYNTVSPYASAGKNYVASSPVQSHSYYYTVPSSSAYNTGSSYATAGKSYPYVFPYSSYQYVPATSANSYLPVTSLYNSYQPGYNSYQPGYNSYFIQSPMAAVSSNLYQTHMPSVGVSSIKYHTPVTRHNY